MIEIYTNGFNMCCGARELGNFPFHGEEVIHKNQEKQEIAQLVEAIKNEKQIWVGKVLIATTIPGQETAVAALRKCGFKVVKYFRNPGSGNMIRMWLIKA